MYVHFDNSNSERENVFLYEKDSQKHNKCTFWKPKCKPVTEKNMVYYLDEAKKTYQSYINKTVECHYNNEKDLAYMTLDPESYIIMIVALGIMVLITLCCCIAVLCL